MRSELPRVWGGVWLLLPLTVAALGCTSSARARDAGRDVVADVPPPDTADESPGETSADSSADSAVDAPGDPPGGAVTTVSTFGCFARSGDGNDYFADGTPATVVTSSPWRAPCGLNWIGLNANGYTKPTTPTTESLIHRFIVDSLISDRATFTISFEADDAAEIVLNGKSIASCTPAPGNAGECQQSCRVVTLSKDDFKPVGQENVLDIKMINLYNTPAPGGNTGYTGISYEICATGE